MNKPSFSLSSLVSLVTDTDSSAAHYTQGDGPVRYMDGSALQRPFELPRRKLPIALAFGAVALVIGIALAMTLLNSTMHAAERAAASVEENLARDVALDLPQSTAYAGMDAAGVKAAVEALGVTTYTLSSDDDLASGTLDMVKLPSDVSVEGAALFYAQGIDNLDGPDAALLLNGSWRLQLDSADGFNLSVRYADFDSGNVDTAVENAIQAQGFDSASASELAVDEAGNTYRTGTVDAGGVTYNWRISAISLSEVYNVSGLPNTAIYVGVRLTQA